jgi:hypothetical protein
MIDRFHHCMVVVSSNFECINGPAVRRVETLLTAAASGV